MILTTRPSSLQNPSNPALRHLDSISAVGGKRILCSGWNGQVRYPNHLGEILMFWSWVMPAGEKLKDFPIGITCTCVAVPFWAVSCLGRAA